MPILLIQLGKLQLIDKVNDADMNMLIYYIVRLYLVLQLNLICKIIRYLLVKLYVYGNLAIEIVLSGLKPVDSLDQAYYLLNFVLVYKKIYENFINKDFRKLSSSPILLQLVYRDHCSMVLIEHFIQDNNA